MNNINKILSTFGKTVAKTSDLEKSSQLFSLDGSVMPSFSSMSTTFNPFIFDASDELPPYQGPLKTVDTWHVMANMLYSTNRTIKAWEDIMEDLDVIIDKYEGSYNYRELFITLYYLMGTHLRPSSSGSNTMHLFKSEIDLRLVINHNFKGLTEKTKDFSWKHESMYSAKKFRVCFNCTISSTKRKGVSLKRVYLVRSIPGLEHPDLSTLLKPHNIDVKEEGDNYLLTYCPN
ncbi:putative matrix protein [Hubei diptera virus 10]|uniref:Matrix protein n=1 Tax=Hubei diptera virus 10 TaxID=1922871 RepID=A0A1L3KMZ9_9RHAB|nr:putative matrix protein [Hubei diptera virus 10]APG78754.1 putative matrix protein [Hubei diptera virus 10]